MCGYGFWPRNMIWDYQIQIICFWKWKSVAIAHVTVKLRTSFTVWSQINFQHFEKRAPIWGEEICRAPGQPSFSAAAANLLSDEGDDSRSPCPFGDHRYLGHYWSNGMGSSTEWPMDFQPCFSPLNWLITAPQLLQCTDFRNIQRGARLRFQGLLKKI